MSPDLRHNHKANYVGDLEITEDLRHERRSWKMEHAGWILIYTFLFLVLLGITGTGFLSQTKTSDAAGTFVVEHERFGRLQRETEMQISTRAPLPERRFSVWLNHDFLEKVEILHIEPAPTAAESAAGGITYHFAVDAEQPPFRVWISYQPGKWWLMNVIVRSGTAGEVHFRQFIFP